MGLNTRYDSVIRFGKVENYDISTGTWFSSGSYVNQACRATPSGTGGLGSSKVHGNDGVQLEYSYNIAFPKSATFLPKAGDTIEIFGTGGNLIFKGTLIQIHYGSYSIRAWA